MLIDRQQRVTLAGARICANPFAHKGLGECPSRIGADTKLMVSWMVGDRDAACAGRFMKDLSDRLADRCQLTTDGHLVYERAVQDAFGWQIDYAMLVKLYGEPREKEARYSPCECI